MKGPWTPLCLNARRTLALLLVVGCLAADSLSAQTYDLVIRHGRVVDGTGNPAFFADVAIRDGRIAALGTIRGGARTEINATNLWIAPGFIDVHTHAEDLEERPLAENFLRMGVTTVVLGNCGSSQLQVGGFFRKLEELKVSPNVATLIGHGTVRSEVMRGSFARPPTESELERMKALVDQAMRDGAVGLATGLIYLPGTFARTEELIELARVAAAHDGIYASHMRDEGNGIGAALQELFRIAREARVRAEISHIKLSGRANWGRPGEVLDAIDKARAEGLDITQDQYVYAASSTGISQLVPETAREGGKFNERIADRAQKEKIIVEMKERLRLSMNVDYGYAMIAEYGKDRSINGLSIPEAALKLRGSSSLENQIELILEIQKNGGASAVFHSMNEEDLQSFLRHPNTMIASDSGVRKLGEGVPHPRGYGNNARVLARYVRELQLLRLEDAVRRMTGLPASTFRLKDRGFLRPGFWADLVLFDPALVRDHSTFKDPHRYASGFNWVLVNGVAVIQDDRHTGARPGQMLRHQLP